MTIHIKGIFRMSLNRLRYLPAVFIIILSTIIGASSYADPLNEGINDKPFYEWFTALTKRVQADPNYHRIPLDTDDQTQQFLGFLRQLYHREITGAQFAQLVNTLYPGHQYEANFIIKSLPQ